MRVLIVSGWKEHNGAAVAFLPYWMTPEELERKYWDLHHELYSARQTVRRIWRSAGDVTIAGLVMNGCANALFSIQNLLRPDHPWTS